MTREFIGYAATGVIVFAAVAAFVLHWGVKFERRFTHQEIKQTPSAPVHARLVTDKEGVKAQKENQANAARLRKLADRYAEERRQIAAKQAEPQSKPEKVKIVESERVVSIGRKR